MSYATNADVLQRMGSTLYVQLTDDAGTGAADEEKVTEARVAAEAEVDSYLGRRYAVPVDVGGQVAAQAILKSITLDLVECRLHSRRMPVPAGVTSKRAAAIAWLERVAAGDVVLPATVELPASEASGFQAVAIGSTRVWGRDEAGDL